MIEALMLTAVLQSGPDHLVAEPVEDKKIEDINFKKPHKGGFSEEITEASTIPKKWKPFASCVLERESGATIGDKNSGEGARNPHSSASGRWQFLGAWQDGLPFMVAEQLRDHGMPKKQAKQVRVHLQSKPIYKWDGRWQDAGAIEVLQQGGWFHWRYGDKCDGKRAR
ncbi:MAG: hypothetical protein EB168_05485 [Euryarchaeota archaeon]|nr:hypothetical protein [Euryarchaeota archaeon]